MNIVITSSVHNNNKYVCCLALVSIVIWPVVLQYQNWLVGLWEQWLIKMFLQATTLASKVLKLIDETCQLFKTIVSIFSLSAIKIELFLIFFPPLNWNWKILGVLVCTGLNTVACPPIHKSVCFCHKCLQRQPQFINHITYEDKIIILSL